MRVGSSAASTIASTPRRRVESHELFRDSVRKFFERELIPHLDARSPISEAYRAFLAGILLYRNDRVLRTVQTDMNGVYRIGDVSARTRRRIEAEEREIGPAPRLVRLQELAPLTTVPVPVDADFEDAALNVNVVLRWEYRPGSTLFVAWSQARDAGDPVAPFQLQRDVRRLFGERPTNALLVKVSYWMGL